MSKKQQKLHVFVILTPFIQPFVNEFHTFFCVTSQSTDDLFQTIGLFWFRLCVAFADVEELVRTAGKVKLNGMIPEGGAARTVLAAAITVVWRKQ